MLAMLSVARIASAAELSGTVVDSAGNGLTDAVVFDKEFVPHVLPVAVGTEVSFPNHDQIHHHVYSFSRSKTFEIPLYKGEAASPVRFDQPGAVKVGCNIHDWMSGVILVVPTPYFAITDERGAFTLQNVPAGPHALVAWHEGAKTPVEASAQRVVAGDGAGPVTFTLDVVRRPRPARGRSWD
jgi:plastocyanin